MKSLRNYIVEKLIVNQRVDEKIVINKGYTSPSYNYHPTTRGELLNAIDEHYNKGIYDLNDIDVSEITNFSNVFNRDKNTGNKNFNISDWNVSNGEDFSGMFYECYNFNSDLSNWNVSKGKYFSNMFRECSLFNSDLSKWNVRNAEDFSGMFIGCEKFNRDLSNWKVGNSKNFIGMFLNCENFNCDLSDWDVSSGEDFEHMFDNCGIENKYKPKGIQ